MDATSFLRTRLPRSALCLSYGTRNNRGRTSARWGGNSPPQPWRKKERERVWCSKQGEQSVRCRCHASDVIIGPMQAGGLYLATDCKADFRRHLAPSSLQGAKNPEVVYDSRRDRSRLYTLHARRIQRVVGRPKASGTQADP